MNLYPNMTDIIYRGEVDSDLREQIHPFIEFYKWLIPTGIHRLFISIDHSRSDRAISTSVTSEYRFANMYFYPAWFTLPAHEKAIHVIHDLIHTANCPYSNFTDEVIHNLCPETENAKLNSYLLERSRVELEGQTQDLAQAIFQRVPFGAN